MRPMIARFPFYATLLALSPAALAAQEGAAAPKPSLLALQSGLMFWTLVVFLLLLFIL